MAIVNDLYFSKNNHKSNSPKWVSISITIDVKELISIALSVNCLLVSAGGVGKKDKPDCVKWFGEITLKDAVLVFLPLDITFKRNV